VLSVSYSASELDSMSTVTLCIYLVYSYNLHVKVMSLIYECHSINKLQNSVILLFFQI